MQFASCAQKDYEVPLIDSYYLVVYAQCNVIKIFTSTWNCFFTYLTIFGVVTAKPVWAMSIQDFG